VVSYDNLHFVFTGLPGETAMSLQSMSVQSLWFLTTIFILFSPGCQQPSENQSEIGLVLAFNRGKESVSPRRMSISIDKLKALDEAELKMAFLELRNYGMIILAGQTKARNWPLKEEDWTDICSETIDEIRRGISKFDEWDKLKAYFSKAIKNTARDKIRKELADKRGGGKVHTTNQIDLASDSTFSDDGFHHLAVAMLQDDLAPQSPLPKGVFSTDSIVTDQVYSNELQEQSRLILAKLNADDRKLLEEAFFERLSHKEIATKYSWTVKSIGGRINRALERLRAHVPDELKKELRSSSTNRPGLA